MVKEASSVGGMEKINGNRSVSLVVISENMAQSLKKINLNSA